MDVNEAVALLEKSRADDAFFSPFPELGGM